MDTLRDIAREIRAHPKLILVDDYELVVQRARSEQRVYFNGKPLSEAKNERFWTSLRILYQGKPGSSVAELALGETREALVESALASARRSSVDPWFRFPLWRAPKPGLRQLSTAPRLLESSCEPQSLGECTFEECFTWVSTDTYLCRKSERADLSHSGESFRARFEIRAQGPSRLFCLSEERARSAPLSQPEATHWAKTQLALAHALRHAKDGQVRGEQFLLLAPQAAARLFSYLAPWFYADRVQRGLSPLAELGQSFALSAALSLIDDGESPEVPEFCPFDLEGVLAQRTPLVTKGKIEGWLHDSYSSARENRPSTGNRVRLEEGQACIGAHWLVVEPSTYPPQALLKAMGEGSILQTLESIEQIAGQSRLYRLRGHGWRVEGGERAQAASEMVITISLLDLLQRAVEVGSDLTAYRYCAAPSILFENVPLGE